MPRQNNDPRKPSQIETLLAVSIRVPIGGAGAGSTPLTRPPRRGRVARRNLRRSQCDQMAALVGIAPNLRAIPASHVTF